MTNARGSGLCTSLTRTLVVTPFCLLLFIPVNAANIFVIDRANNVVVELDGTPGAHLQPGGGFIGVFGETEGNLSVPIGLAFHPITGNLFVSEVGNGGDVREFDGATGAFLGSFGETKTHLILVRGLTFLPDSGNLLVADVGGTGAVKEFDSSTGVFSGSFGETETNVSVPRVLAIHPDTGNLFALDCPTAGCEVREFDGTTGAFVGNFGTTAADTGSPTDMTFDENGDLLITDAAGGEVRVFDGTTGAFVESFGGPFLGRPEGIAAGSVLVTDNTSPSFGVSVVVFDEECPSNLSEIQDSATGGSGPQQRCNRGAYNEDLQERRLAALTKASDKKPAGILEVTPESGFSLLDKAGVGSQNQKVYELRAVGGPVTWFARNFVHADVSSSHDILLSIDGENFERHFDPRVLNEGSSISVVVRALTFGTLAGDYEEKFSFIDLTSGKEHLRSVRFLYRIRDPEGFELFFLPAAWQYFAEEPPETAATIVCTSCDPPSVELAGGNVGSDILQGTLSADVEFLSLTHLSGVDGDSAAQSLTSDGSSIDLTMEPGELIRIRVTPNQRVNDLPLGVHTATLTFTDADTQESVETNTIRMVIVEALADLYRLYFAQFGEGLGQLFSQLVLFNLDPQMEATVRVDLKDDDGEELGVDINEVGIVGSVPVTIPPSGIRILATDGEGSLKAGSVVVTSDKPVAGVILFGGVVGLAGVGSGQVTQNGFLAPMETNSGEATNTGIAIMSLEDEEVTIQLRLCDTEGNVISTASVTLPARGHTAQFVDQFAWDPPVDFSNFLGLLKAIVDGKQLVATVIQARGGEFATMPVAARPGNGVTPAFLPLVAQPSGADGNLLYYAQFGEGLGLLFSQLLLFNLDTEMQASADITLKDDLGQPLTVDLNGGIVEGQTNVQIPPSGLRLLKTDGEGELIAGSVTVSSDKPLAGVILFGGSVGVAGVGASLELPNGFLALVQTALPDINSGLAVMNLENVPVTVTLKLFDEDGNELATAQLPLSAMGHRSLFVSELEWAPAVDFSELTGVIVATANGRIAATVIQTRPGQFATMPVAERPAGKVAGTSQPR